MDEAGRSELDDEEDILRSWTDVVVKNRATAEEALQHGRKLVVVGLFQQDTITQRES